MLYLQFWAPDDGQKNCLKHVERLTEINKLWNVASCWLYSANILAMHGPMNANPICTTKVYRGSGSTPPLIHNFSTGWRQVVSLTLWPLYPSQEALVPTEEKAGKPQSWPGHFTEDTHIAPAGIQTTNHPAHSLVTILVILFHQSRLCIWCMLDRASLW